MRTHLHVLMVVVGLGLLPTATQAQADARATQISAEETAIRAAVAKASDSVVQIRTIGGLEQIDRTLLPDGPTTGLVISSDGWIVSSAFNFVQQPASILVTFANGEQAPAELIAKDHSRMLVLLKAQGVNGLAVPQVVPVDEIQVGQWAIAIGRTFRADRPNISVGIVSAMGRMFGKAIQTDADISTANYGGPLVDIRGRVLGVLVPMSPQATSELAGAEWYDSGVGFAVPLASLSAAIERMKTGADQHTGVMGIGMAMENSRAGAADLVSVLPSSPAGKAGLKKGDRIVEIDGRPIRTQNELRFALGTKYAGETVAVVAQRGDEQLKRSIELVGELEPFRHAFLGILPMRSSESPRPPSGEPGKRAAAVADAEKSPAAGVVVRAVYPGSPAAGAGIVAGDRILKIGDSDVANVKAAIDAMNGVMVGTSVAVELRRGDESRTVTLLADRLPTSVPNSVPAAVAAQDVSKATTTTPDTAADKRTDPIHELKLAEFPESCRVYIPKSLADGQAAGMLLWLHAPGDPPTDQLFENWEAICERDGLIFVAPTAADPKRWERTELEYLRRLSERVLADYRIDPRRVVVGGQDGGGAMAYLLGLAGRDMFRGVATTAAALPRTIDPPAAQPPARLAIFAGLPTDAARVAQTQVGLKKFADAGYPVTAIAIASGNGNLSSAEREQLARWLDTLDHF